MIQLIFAIASSVFLAADFIFIYLAFRNLRKLKASIILQRRDLIGQLAQFEAKVIDWNEEFAQQIANSAAQHAQSVLRHEASDEEHRASDEIHQTSMERHDASDEQHRISAVRHDAAVQAQAKQQATLEFAIQAVGNVVQKKLAVMQDSDICSECHLHVAKYFTRNGQVICKNCDFDGYKAGV